MQHEMNKIKEFMTATSQMGSLSAFAATGSRG
jgi:hypothetical protein